MTDAAGRLALEYTRLAKRWGSPVGSWEAPDWSAAVGEWRALRDRAGASEVAVDCEMMIAYQLARGVAQIRGAQSTAERQGAVSAASRLAGRDLTADDAVTFLQHRVVEALLTMMALHPEPIWQAHAGWRLAGLRDQYGMGTPDRNAELRASLAQFPPADVIASLLPAMVVDRTHDSEGWPASSPVLRPPSEVQGTSLEG